MLINRCEGGLICGMSGRCIVILMNKIDRPVSELFRDGHIPFTQEVYGCWQAFLLPVLSESLDTKPF